ncbi:MAG: cupredoxin domain-containing protein [Candidatus Limnocylindria bacterium]
MSTEQTRARHERREAERIAAHATQKPSRAQVAAAERRSRRIRGAAFGLIVVAVLGAGLYLAGGVFLGQRDKTTVADALPVRLSMAGFDPKVITAKAGATLNLDFWNTDNAIHLDGGGVHTFIMDDQHIYVTIPAEGRQAFSFTVPMKPGDYDFYCDTCCGGKASPTMHGILRVEA